MTKPVPALTAQQRTELHDRPFRTLFIDTVGPISPADGDFKYIAHAECPFSRFVWLCCMKENSEAEWAEFLTMHVYFDLCGFPTVLRSDRGSEFTGAIVKAINTLLGVEHAFGSSYHPQSQGYVEARHKVVNQTLAAYAKAHPGKWARSVKLCQWAMRATPRADRDGKSPFEIITGLKPQGPLNRIFEKVSSTTLAPNAYVRDLCTHLEQTQKNVAVQLSADFAKRVHKNEKYVHKNEWLPKPGDIVLLRRPPQAAASSHGKPDGEAAVHVSARLQPLTAPKPYKVKKVVGSKSYILEDVDTGSTELSFSQPVALARLVPFDLCQLEAPINDDEELWIDIKSNQPGRTDRWLARRIVAQQSTGAVRLVSADGQQEEIIDLADYEWRWRALPRTGTMAVFGKYDPRKRDRNSPFAHPAAGDTEGWIKVFTPLIQKFKPYKLCKLPEVILKNKGKEKELYKMFLQKHLGDARNRIAKKDLKKNQCRICGQDGHWGNECPEKFNKRFKFVDVKLEPVPEPVEELDDPLADFFEERPMACASTDADIEEASEEYDYQADLEYFEKEEARYLGNDPPSPVSEAPSPTSYLNAWPPSPRAEGSEPSSSNVAGQSALQIHLATHAKAILKASGSKRGIGTHKVGTASAGSKDGIGARKIGTCSTVTPGVRPHAVRKAVLKPRHGKVHLKASPASSIATAIASAPWKRSQTRSEASKGPGG